MMATLFEINRAIESCISWETGEIMCPKVLDSLKMDKHEKLRNIAFVALNAKSDIEAYKEQEQRFKAKRAAAEKTLAWAKETLTRELAGRKMKEAEFSLYYTPSEVLEIDEGAEIPAEYLKQKEPEIDKAGLKKAIQNEGLKIPGCRIVEKTNLQIR